MADDEFGNLQEFYKKKLREKLDLYNEKTRKIFADLTMKREEAKVLNAKINSLNEELVYYEHQLNFKTSNQTDTENITSSEETTEKQSSYDDHLLVYNTLKTRLQEISKRLLEVDNVQENKIIYSDEPIQFQCVCILFVADMLVPNDISYQTFRITHETKVYNIIESGLALWDQREKEDVAKLYFYESEDSWKFVSRNENVNNVIKNNKSSLKRAKFLLSVNNFKPHTDELSQEKDQNKAMVINKDQTDKKFFDYTKNFVGLAQYVQEKYSNIKDKENRPEKDDKKPISYYYWFFYGLNILFLILFLIFLIVSNNVMLNPTKSYAEIQILQNQFVSAHFSNPKEIIKFIFNLFSPYTLGKNNVPFKMISTTRLAFYDSLTKDCAERSDVCYETYYSSDPNYKKVIITTTNNDLPDFCQNFACQLLTSDGNEGTLSDYLSYLNGQVFSGPFSLNNNVDKTKIKGKYGVFNGENCFNLYLSLSYMTDGFLCIILETMNKNGYFDYITKKALVISFATENVISQNFYYVSLVFEFSSSEKYWAPLVRVDPFYPNLNEIKPGKLILVTDVFRLLFSIYMLLFLFYKLYSLYCQYTDNSISLEQLASKSLTLETLCDFGIFLIEVIAFSAKINNLYVNTEEAQKVQEFTLGDKSYLHLPQKEYYPIMANYQYAMMLEGFLMLFVLCRLLTYSIYYVRIRKFFSFIRTAFIKACPYFLAILLFILMFAIYAHNLWGEKSASFSSYSSSFFFVLDFSFGLFQNVFSNINNDYEVIFIFLFVGIVIFFLQSSLFGVYLESYRLNSLRKGNLYKKRVMKTMESLDETKEKDLEVV